MVLTKTQQQFVNFLSSGHVAHHIGNGYWHMVACRQPNDEVFFRDRTVQSLKAKGLVKDKYKTFRGIAPVILVTKDNT